MPPGVNAEALNVEPLGSWNKCPALPMLTLIFYVSGSAAFGTLTRGKNERNRKSRVCVGKPGGFSPKQLVYSTE